jgi:hypothetical protein
MSEERFEQDEGEDVEAHKRSQAAADEGSKESDDVEAHKKGSQAMNVEPGSDDESDDVEAHARKASHHHGV